MAKAGYMGVADVARKVKRMYIGVDGVARKVKKAYIGVDGVARLWWNGEVKQVVYGTVTATTTSYGVNNIKISALAFQPKGFVFWGSANSGNRSAIDFAYDNNSIKMAVGTHSCTLIRTDPGGMFIKDTTNGKVDVGEDYIEVSTTSSYTYFYYTYTYVIWG